MFDFPTFVKSLQFAEQDSNLFEVAVFLSCKCDWFASVTFTYEEITLETLSYFDKIHFE